MSLSYHQGHQDTMSLSHHQRRQLRRMEARMLRSDPQLAAMLTIFARLSAGEFMPAWEQIATRQGRIGQAAALVAKVIAVISAATRFVLSTPLLIRARFTSPTRPQARPDPGADGRFGPPGAAADR
jgi:hypothetical protein